MTILWGDKKLNIRLSINTTDGIFNCIILRDERSGCQHPNCVTPVVRIAAVVGEQSTKEAYEKQRRRFPLSYTETGRKILKADAISELAS